MTTEELRERARREVQNAPPLPISAQQTVIALMRPHMPQRQASTRRGKRVNAA